METKTNFDYDSTPSNDMYYNLMKSADELVPIISETDGGIIGYAISLPHAMAMIRALNAAEGEYEAEMIYHVQGEFGGCQHQKESRT